MHPVRIVRRRSAAIAVLLALVAAAPARAATDYLALRERLQVERPKLREAMKPYLRASTAAAFPSDKPGVAFGKYLDAVWRHANAKQEFPEVYESLKSYRGKVEPSDPVARQALAVLLGDYLQVRYGDDVLRELRTLVGFKTFNTVVTRNAENPQFRSCFDALAALAQGLGLKVENRSYEQLLVTLPATGAAAGAPPIGVWTHADVTRPIDHKWGSSPWTLTERNNRWVGVGVYDDKAPIITNLFAMRVLRDANTQLARPVVLAVSADGEGLAANAGASFAAVQPRPSVVLAADGAFPWSAREMGRAVARVSSSRGMKSRTGIKPGQYYIHKMTAGQGENSVPSEARVWVRYEAPVNTPNPALVQTNKWRAEIEAYQKNHTTAVYETYIQEDTLHFFVYGTPSHVQEMDGAVNSIYDAAGALQRLGLYKNSASDVMLWIDKALQHDASGKDLGIAFEHPEMGATTVSPVGFDRLGDEVTVLVDIRWPLGQNTEWIRSKVAASVQAFNTANGTKLTVAWEGEPTEPQETPPPRALREALDEAYALASGEGAQPASSVESCARLLPGAVPFGPAWARGASRAHTRDESISLRELDDLGVAYVAALAFLAAGASPATP